MLVFEKSRQGRGNGMLPKWEGETFELPKTEQRQKKLHLPEIAEGDLSRHYSELARKSHGVNDGFYPLGSCTMKYNPKINETAAAFRDLRKFIRYSRNIRCKDVWKCLKQRRKRCALLQEWTIWSSSRQQGPMGNLQGCF